MPVRNFIFCSIKLTAQELISANFVRGVVLFLVEKGVGQVGLIKMWRSLLIFAECVSESAVPAPN